MIYLGRQVFPFTINWRDAIERSCQFNLNELMVGFGAEYFTPTQTYTVIGWDFGLQFMSGADILAWETFADALVGRLNGFWLPCPLRAAQFVSGISTTQFKVAYEDLATSWNTRPDQHLLVQFGGNQYAAKINGVVNNGDGTETVTLTGGTALPSIPTADTILQRLHYVRFANDVETHALITEGQSKIKLTATELPLEYTNAATGLQPIFLYHFFAKTPVNANWYYTSFAAPVASAGKLYNVFPITHGAIKHTIDGNSNQLDITAKPDAAHPLSMIVGIPPGQSLWVDVMLVYIGAPDVQTKIWSGYASKVNDAIKNYIANCDTRLRWLKTKLPRYYIGTTCNNTLYDPKTCKVPRAIFETTVAFYAIVAGQLPKIQVAFTQPFNLDNYKTADWFRNGMLESGLGNQYEIRSILNSTWNGAQLVLTLNAPIVFAQIGNNIQIVTGCDHTADTCKTKFNNFENAALFVDVPEANLALEGINTSAAQGNKKI